MIRKISIRNYRIFRSLDLEFQPGINVLVGDNDCGKSTLLEAIVLALTGRISGRLAAQELTPHLFNAEAAAEYVAAIRAGHSPVPPEITIDVYFQDDPKVPLLVGSNNVDGEDCAGVRVRISLDDDYREEYRAYIAKCDEVKLVPAEYYRVDWMGFSGNGVTFRSIPGSASLIDASRIRLQSGTDYYLQGIIANYLEPRERVELARAYRSLRESFAANPAMASINSKLAGEPGDRPSERTLSLSIDVSQGAAWENNLVPHLNDLPFSYIGKGEQSTLKILLALARKLEDAHVLLIEELENHLSFSRLHGLISRIAERCAGKQVIVTTHSSFVLNKLGLGRVILLRSSRGLRLTDLPADTQDYFMKLSGYDTLRIVLARKAILVEGPSDELVVQRAYRDRTGMLPIEDGVDVINVRGLSFRRFLDIAKPLGIQTRVITDNDGKPEADVEARYAAYTREPHIRVHAGKGPDAKTLEPQIVRANDLDQLNRILHTNFQTKVELIAHMTDSHNKTTCALRIFESTERITVPEYIRDALA